MATHPNADICVFPEGPTACADARVGCFPCNLRHRANHGVSVQFTYGRDVFHGQTIKERQDHEVAQAAAMGNEIRPKDGRHFYG